MAAIGRPPDALEVVGLTKRYGPNVAVREVSLRIPAGSVTGVVGENGAGKSTLMNLVYGLAAPDSGTILVDGREARIAGPQDAIRLGIGMVHQHFLLVDTLSVVENVVLGVEDGILTGPILEKARAELARIAGRFGLHVDPDATVGDLAVGDQQRVEILKVLFRGARILILDEPTAVLTPGEADRLFAILRELAATGVTLVLITHKLREIMAVTDAVHVMRSGMLVASRATRDTNPAELAELMVGRAGRTAAPPSPLRGGPSGREASDRGGGRAEGTPGGPSCPTPTSARPAQVGCSRLTPSESDLGNSRGPGDSVLPARGRTERGTAPLLEARDLVVRDPATGIALLDGVSLTLHAGEIVGVAGVSGNGQGELLEALAGMRPLARGTIRFGGREITPARPADPAEMRRLGLAHVPEHRHRHGMIDAFPAAETAILGRQGRRDIGGPVLRPGAIRAVCARLMARLDVRPTDPDLPSGRFSGGNQQKLVVAREVEPDPAVLLAGQPTRGVDIGAITTIHGEIRRLRERGSAILLVSAELDEILALSDRILVMLSGRIVGEVPGGPEADPGAIGRMMAGAAEPARRAA